MSIRRIFLALVAPLFVLLAAVNGGLLYVWEKAEAEKGLEGEAIAAAVTVAAFLSTPERTRAALSDAVRAQALEQAVARSPGLEGVWIVESGRPALRLAGEGGVAGLGPVAAGPPRALPVRLDQGGPHVLGLADAGAGRTVVARIDAAPLFERVAGLQRLIAVLIAGVGGVGLVLALVIARMIGRELARNSAQVAAEDGASAPDQAVFRIRETRDLGAAVRLMRASVSGRMARGRRELLRRDRSRTSATSVSALRPSLSPPVAADAAGRRVAARLVGAPGPGVFVAFSARDGRAGVVLAEAAADFPPDALALALAARRALEATLLDGDPAQRVDEARAAFGLTRTTWTVWSIDEAAPGLEVLGLAEDPGALSKARTYAGRARGLGPGEVLDDLEALLGVDGAIAVIGPSTPLEAQ
ncbi:hypothetical protein [Phenylobacterium sp.]|uniref:hypothetical protein n=1 Tax=Phenylobacterium sp. TaxID=1871053 RepID=UPI00301E1BC5